MTVRTRILMTASEFALGRLMRAPDHPTAESGGTAAEAAPEAAPEQVAAPEAGEKVAADTEDFAAFDNAVNKDELGDVESPAPGADPDEKSGSEDEPKSEEKKPEEGADEEKKGKSAQERFDELTVTAREAERRAAELDRVLADPAELRRRLEALDPGAKKPEEKGEPRPEGLLEGEPNPNDYEYGEADSQFIKDSSAFHARYAFQMEKNRDALQSEFKAIDKAYEQRAEKAVERYPDFEEKVVASASGPNPSWKATPVMALAMRTSEVGPDVAYHLATHPAESERIAALSPLEQAREMGRLDGRFMYHQEKTEPARKISDAPKPPTDITRGAGGKFATAPDTDDFSAFDKSYKSEASGG